MTKFEKGNTFNLLCAFLSEFVIYMGIKMTCKRERTVHRCGACRMHNKSVKDEKT